LELQLKREFDLKEKQRQIRERMSKQREMNEERKQHFEMLRLEEKKAIKKQKVFPNLPMPALEARKKELENRRKLFKSI
jgi:hypothetical protein